MGKWFRVKRRFDFRVHCACRAHGLHFARPNARRSRRLNVPRPSPPGRIPRRRPPGRHCAESLDGRRPLGSTAPSAFIADADSRSTLRSSSAWQPATAATSAHPFPAAARPPRGSDSVGTLAWTASRRARLNHTSAPRLELRERSGVGVGARGAARDAQRAAQKDAAELVRDARQPRVAHRPAKVAGDRRVPPPEVLRRRRDARRGGRHPLQTRGALHGPLLAPLRRGRARPRRAGRLASPRREPQALDLQLRQREVRALRSSGAPGIAQHALIISATATARRRRVGDRSVGEAPEGDGEKARSPMRIPAAGAPRAPAPAHLGAGARRSGALHGVEAPEQHDADAPLELARIDAVDGARREVPRARREAARRLAVVDGRLQPRGAAGGAAGGGGGVTPPPPGSALGGGCAARAFRGGRTRPAEAARPRPSRAPDANPPLPRRGSRGTKPAASSARCAPIVMPRGVATGGATSRGRRGAGTSGRAGRSSAGSQAPQRPRGPRESASSSASSSIADAPLSPSLSSSIASLDALVSQSASPPDPSDDGAEPSARVWLVRGERNA